MHQKDCLVFCRFPLSASVAFFILYTTSIQQTAFGRSCENRGAISDFIGKDRGEREFSAVLAGNA